MPRDSSSRPVPAPTRPCCCCTQWCMVHAAMMMQVTGVATAPRRVVVWGQYGRQYMYQTRMQYSPAREQHAERDVPRVGYGRQAAKQHKGHNGSDGRRSTEEEQTCKDEHRREERRLFTGATVRRRAALSGGAKNWGRYGRTDWLLEAQPALIMHNVGPMMTPSYDDSLPCPPHPMTPSHLSATSSLPTPPPAGTTRGRTPRGTCGSGWPSRRWPSGRDCQRGRPHPQLDHRQLWGEAKVWGGGESVGREACCTHC